MKKVILNNGLKLFIIPDKTKHSTFVSLNVLFGALDNKCYVNNKIENIKSGVAHFTEHLVLESNCYGDLMYNYGKIGIISNGATDINKTEFYIDAVTNIMDAIKILIKGIHTPVINKEVIDNIKKPILEEKNRSLDNCYSYIYNKGVANVFNDDYDSILGSIKDLKAINQKDIELAFNSFYRPSNEIMVVMGNINEDDIIDLVETTYNSLSFSDTDFKKYNYTDNIIINNKYELIETSLTVDQTVLVFVFNNIFNNPLDKLNMDLYIYYFLKMNFGNMSDFNQKMLKDKIINSPISYSSSIIKGKLNIRIYAKTNNNDIFVNSILELLDNNYVFDKEIFDLSKRSVIINLISRKDSISSTVEPLISNIIEYNYEKEDTIEDIENCTFEKFKTNVKKLDFSNYFIYQIKNKKN